MAKRDIGSRVRDVAEQQLAQEQYVRPVDVLLGLSWLAHSHVERWQQGRIPCLENEIQTAPDKVATAMAELRRWAQGRGLQPSETAYVSRTRDRRPLQFSQSGDAAVERAYRTSWISPDMPERRRARLAAQQSRPPDLVVIDARNPWTCSTCGAEHGSGSLLLMQDEGPHCLACVHLAHLEYLPAGNATVTRRAKAASDLSAVVVRWSRTRRRYEREGVLVEADALRQAEARAQAEDSSSR